MIIFLLFIFSVLHARIIDCVEVGSLDDISSIYFVSTRDATNSPLNAEEAPLDNGSIHAQHSTYTAWFDSSHHSNLERTLSAQFPPFIRMSIADINQDHTDDAVLLSKNNPLDHSQCQVTIRITDPLPLPSQSVLYNLCFSLENATELFVNDLDNNTINDVLIAKITDKTFQYQLTMNVQSSQNSNQDIQSLVVPFMIHEAIFVKGIGKDEGLTFLILRSQTNRTLYVFNPVSLTFELIENLATGSHFKKISPFYATKSEFIADYNCFIQNSNHLALGRIGSLSNMSFKRIHVQKPSNLPTSLILTEVYIPTFFENRVAIWYQEENSDSGQLIFFQMIDEGPYFSLIPEDNTEITPIEDDSQPQIIIYLPAYLKDTQPEAGHTGQWVCFHSLVSPGSFSESSTYTHSPLQSTPSDS